LIANAEKMSVMNGLFYATTSLVDDGVRFWMELDTPSLPPHV